MLDAIHKKAKEVGGTAHVHLSQTHDSEKNPLSHDDKVHLVKKMMPHHAHMIHSEKHVKTIIDAAKHHSDANSHLHVVVGEDRVHEFHKLLHKYNGKDYHYKSITVHSAGHRDPDAEGAEGMSATKLRNHAKAGEYEHFKKGLPSSTSEKVAKDAYHKVRKGMKLEEALVESVNEETLEEKKILNLAPDSKAKAKKLIRKLADTVIARNLNRQKELEAKYGDQWDDKLKQQADVKADRAVRGKKLTTFVEEAQKIKKKKDKVVINPTPEEI